MGLCAGGITASCAVGHLAAKGDLERIAGLTLGVCVLDNENAGTVGALVDRPTAAAALAESQRKGYLDGRALAGVFAWLRPNDLVWNYWVNNYLLGKDPPAFDVLYWNADSTNLPAALHRDFMELSLANDLVRPGERVVLDTPIDLSQITVDSYQVAGHRRPHHAVAEQLPLDAAARLPAALRALDQRAHRLARQPARQREGQLPGQRLQPARGGGVAARRHHAQGHVVGRLRGVAGRALRAPRSRPASASAARASSRSIPRRAPTCWTDACRAPTASTTSATARATRCC